MRNITYLDTIRHTPNMKNLSIKTTVDPIKHQLEGGSIFEPPRFLKELSQRRHGGGIGSLDKDPLRGGSFFGDLTKIVSFLPIPFVSDAARSLTLSGLVK